MYSVMTSFRLSIAGFSQPWIFSQSRTIAVLVTFFAMRNRGFVVANKTRIDRLHDGLLLYDRSGAVIELRGSSRYRLQKTNHRRLT